MPYLLPQCPLIILGQSCYQEIAGCLGRLHRHRDMAIFEPQRYGRTIPPLPYGLRIKAGFPVTVSLAPFRILLPPPINLLLGRSAPSWSTVFLHEITKPRGGVSRFRKHCLLAIHLLYLIYNLMVLYNLYFLGCGAAASF